MTVEMVLLAMVGLFVGLRLYSVLGRRTGHEQQPIVRPADGPARAEPAAADVPASAEPVAERPEALGLAYGEGAETGVRAIIAADHGFDVARFLDGARAAYKMILEAFWKGDAEELRHLTGPDVLASFAEAITARETAGHKLENRLIRIDRALIHEAELEGRVASVTVRFDADIAAVTRDGEGAMVAGTMNDAVATHDLWTFRRTLGSDDPNWVLVDTDVADQPDKG